MMRLEPPKQFSFKAEDWPNWISEFRRFRNASKLAEEEGVVQRDTLLYVMGPESEKVFRSLTFNMVRDDNDREVRESDTDFELLVRKFDEYFVVKRNIIYERAKLQQRSQQHGESVEEFYRALKELARYCAYRDEDDQIRDRLVVGLLDGRLKEKLQLLPDLTLNRALDVARQHEQVKAQWKAECSSQSVSNADETSSRRHSQSRGRGFPRSRGGNSKRDSRSTKRSQCSKCGYFHNPDNCPAQGKKCQKCHKRNHFKKMCRTQVREVVNDAENCEDECNIDSVVNDENEPWTVYLKVKGTEVKFKIDSGADVSVLSEDTFKKLKHKPTLTKSRSVLTSPGGKLKVCGEFYAYTRYKDEQYQFRVVVVANRLGSNLLSRTVASRMGLIQRVEQVHHNVFGAAGLLKTEPVNIKLAEGAEPYCVTTARRVPFPLQNKVKAELDRMKAAGIIQEVIEPSDWCAPMVPVVKPNGSVRICVDFKKLNQAVKRPNCHIPNLDDIAPKLSGSVVFSTLDASSGFYQVPLQEQCMKLTTFITPYGRFCFRRVPMGISLGPEVFQHKMQELLHGLEGCETIMDDSIVYGRSMEEHDKRLNAVLDRIESSGLKLNRSKCHLRQKEVKYFGHIISGSGIRADPDKVKAIVDMPPPKSMTELRSMCGMLNWLSKFVPHMSSTMKPITNLLHKEAAWCWGPSQEQAFKKVKEQISSSPALAFYDPERQTVVSADSSSYGLGATLLQYHGDRLVPVAYASRTLTDAERKYAQIEKECLASVFACEKFSQYLIGLDRFELLTDHKPLVPLMNTKDIDKTPIRCQRLLMRLMRFNLVVRHVPGKEIVISDALSRNPVPHSREDKELAENVTAYVDAITSSSSITSRRLEALRADTVHDPVLQQVIGYILHGWPSSVSRHLQPYHQVQGELSVVDGLVAYNNRIVVPTSQRKHILQQLHKTHQGLHKCRFHAQATVWWPGLSRELKELVNSCKVCREQRPAQRHEPLRPTPLPQRPWQKLGADLCSFQGKEYLVTVDYYSRWLEIHQLHSTTAAAVIKKFRLMFSAHGIPEVIVTDNGPQFQCREFAEFAQQYDFQHRTSSPGFPQANGEAESGVKIAKKILQQKDFELALLNYRATAHSSTGVSPAAALMGRQLRTLLPVLPQNLQPQPVDDNYIRKTDAETKKNYTQAYNQRKGVQPLPDLKPGDSVLIQSSLGEKAWDTDGSVVAADSGNRTYLVDTPGGVLRRNRKHIQQLPTLMPEDPVPVPQATTADTQGNVPYRNPVPVIAPDDIPSSDVPDQPLPVVHSRPFTRAQKGYTAGKPARFRDDYV